MVPALFEKCLPQDDVESVLKIDLEKNGIRATCVPSAPLAGHMQAHLGAARLRDADLKWPQIGTCLLLKVGAEELCSEAAPSLTDSHRADGAIVFRQSRQSTTGEIGSKDTRRLTLGQELCQSGDVSNYLVAVGTVQSLLEVQGSKGGGACARMRAKRPYGS